MVDVLRAGAAVRRSVLRRSLFVDSARTPAGDLGLLVEQGAPRPLERPGRLVLYRVRRSGGVRRVWSGGSAGHRGAAVARRGARVAVAWLARVPSRRTAFGRPVLRLATPARRLDSLPFVCAAAGARLVEGAGGRFAILWGTAEELPGHDGVVQAPTIRLALAPSGGSFGAAATVLRDVAPRSATFDAGGAIVVAMTRPADTLARPYGGPLVVQRVGRAAAATEPVTLDAAGAGVVLSDTGPDGRPVVAWQSLGGRLRVATGGAIAG